MMETLDSACRDGTAAWGGGDAPRVIATASPSSSDDASPTPRAASRPPTRRVSAPLSSSSHEYSIVSSSTSAPNGAKRSLRGGGTHAAAVRRSDAVAGGVSVGRGLRGPPGGADVRGAPRVALPRWDGIGGQVVGRGLRALPRGADEGSSAPALAARSAPTGWLSLHDANELLAWTRRRGVDGDAERHAPTAPAASSLPRVDTRRAAAGGGVAGRGSASVLWRDAAASSTAEAAADAAADATAAKGAGTAPTYGGVPERSSTVASLCAPSCGAGGGVLTAGLHRPLPPSAAPAENPADGGAGTATNGTTCCSAEGSAWLPSSSTPGSERGASPSSSACASRGGRRTPHGKAAGVVRACMAMGAVSSTGEAGQDGKVGTRLRGGGRTGLAGGDSGTPRRGPGRPRCAA